MIGSILFPTFVPLRARTVEAFTAADPWHGGRGPRWSLEVFRMVSMGLEEAYTKRGVTLPQQGEGGQLGRGETLGLLNRAEKRPRLLPIALAQLWQEGRVATSDLPRLMAQIEPRTLT